jgi:hypothetical protein
MFIGCFRICWGMANEDKSVCLSLNKINKLIVHNNTTAKLPNVHNKQEIITFFDNMNTVSASTLGGTIEFTIQNPEALSDKNKNVLTHKIQMYNSKTRNILHTLQFTFAFDIMDGQTVLGIEPVKNDFITTTHWTYMDSLLYNMGFRIKKIYAEKK